MMKVDLILFELDELDVILRMNFLTKYHVILNYSNKEVVLRNPRRFEVKFKGDKKVKLIGIISVLKARRLMKKRHATNLVHVVDTQASQSDPSRVPIASTLMCFRRNWVGFHLGKKLNSRLKLCLGLPQFLKPLVTWHEAN